jgi:hypothetical protein
MKILQLEYFTRRRVPTLDNYLRQEYLKVKPQPTRSFILISILFQCEIKQLNFAGREMSTKLLCSK